MINPLRRLGRTGLMVSALSLGGAGIGRREEVTDRSAIETVEAALRAGIKYIDTSPLYGESERRVGLALKGVPRGEYVLSTKTGTHPARRGDYSWDGTHWSVENSLRLLHTDYIDLLLVHDPRDEQDMDAIFSPRGALEALEALKAQGVIGHIGLGQRSHDRHRRAIRSGRFDAILTFHDYHPIRATALTGGLLRHAKEHDVGVINGSPLGLGLLAGQEPPEGGSPEFQADATATRRLLEWCRDRGISILALALQFSLRQPLIDCTLTGAKSAEELHQNLNALAEPLPDSVWAELDPLGLTEGQAGGC